MSSSSRLPFWLAVLPLASLQPAPARYTAAQFACATFLEEIRTEIRSTIGTVVREERAGRDGVLVLRATGSDSLLELTAWYDSLTVWREGPEGRFTPDARGCSGDAGAVLSTAPGAMPPGWFRSSPMK